MAFTQCANILIEPNMALYEFADSSGNEKANQEFHTFHTADNLHPKYWADIALGQSKQLIPEDLDLPSLKQDSINFKMPLAIWRTNYMLVLKIAELELTGNNPEHLMTEVMRWMYEDFLFKSAGLSLAINFLNQNYEGRKKLFKDLKSEDREKAIKGIRNATWDLTYLSEWQKRVNEQEQNNRIIIFCSLDKPLRKLARSLISDLLFQDWGVAAENRLRNQYESYVKDIDNPNRKYNSASELGSKEDLIRSGENFIRGWKRII
jgi:hypothetical protein